MPSRLGFLETRVGRRMLAHFLAASLLPAVLVSVAGVLFIRGNLAEQRQERVARSAKAGALLVLGGLSVRADNLRRTAEALSGRLTVAGATPGPQPGAVSLSLVADRSDATDGALELSWRAAGEARIVEELTAAPYWNAVEETIAADGSVFCVFEMAGWSRVHCAPEVTPADVARLRRAAVAAAGADEPPAERGVLVAHRDVFLTQSLGVPSWRLVVENRSQELDAADRYITTTLAILLGLAVVIAFLFAHRQIRISTEPLRELRDATRRVRHGDLSSTVDIRSGDEFRELGASFNEMTAALSEQLRMLRALDAIDDVALKERDQGTIASRAVQALLETKDWASASVGHVSSQRPDRMLSVEGSLGESALGSSTEILETPGEANGGIRRGDSRIEFPLRHADETVGVVRLVPRGSAPSAEDAPALVAARRIAERTATALGSVRLHERLEALSAGTLRAFARAIDANSPWTAGHSERVTHRALAIGRILELSRADLGRLYRGGLLHDIGKVGVPPSILDKTEGLTPRERALIERHPVVGEQILSPIPGFTDVLPIVRSHHERYDGSGYPDRLAGEDIPWLAAVLAVADTFDAMTSNRPYRSGLSAHEARAAIVAESGRQFDPRVVEAFVRLDLSRPPLDVAADLRTESAAFLSAGGGVPVGVP
ncbi:MAG: HD domain-containing protein [Gemmatimonadales bacterium]|nr:HD domain-containing protein [Gemmatimonadales bacterium]